MNKLAKLKQSEQILIAITLFVIIIGAYSLFRFIPKYQDISSLALNAEKTERKLLKARIPNEPDQDAKQLLSQLDDQELAMALISDMANRVQERLAPVDSQELKVLISQLARDLKVRITTNERIEGKTPALKVVAKKKRKKKNNKKAATVNQDTNHIALPASYSWLDRMAPNTLYYRPLQRIQLVGHYRSIREFTQELNNLPWQVTVVRLKIEKQSIMPLRGYAQALKAELVLAL
jgi:Tfp pilus assembly protein PilO